VQGIGDSPTTIKAIPLRKKKVLTRLTGIPLLFILYKDHIKVELLALPAIRFMAAAVEDTIETKAAKRSVPCTGFLV
ncbi:MAG: hypothetical protein ACYTDW_00580, partial [Planctomycetota bacterium]